jgi:3-phenylpropionate/trans-cinnamate dioxygenase ferredoxin subunit
LLRAVESTAPGDVRYGNHYLVACPWHGWEFDIRTGQSWFDPARMRVRNYPVSVETGAAVEKGPYVAETYPVSVEDDYLTIEL